MVSSIMLHLLSFKRDSVQRIEIHAFCFVWQIKSWSKMPIRRLLTNLRKTPRKLLLLLKPLKYPRDLTVSSNPFFLYRTLMYNRQHSTSVIFFDLVSHSRWCITDGWNRKQSSSMECWRTEASGTSFENLPSQHSRQMGQDCWLFTCTF